jgi:hypothetical protein
VALALGVLGCGSGSTSTSAPQTANTPDAAALSQIKGSFADIALACLTSPVDETRLDTDTNTLVDAFKNYDNARFSIGGPPLTLRSILERSRDQLRNCAAAGRARNASSLADQIDHQLEK